MPQHDIVVIGGSAGALRPLMDIVERLPPHLCACLVIAIHTSAEDDGVLPQILGRHARLPVSFAHDLAPLTHGRIYVAPPDRHVLVTAEGIRLVHGPRENGFRPAIDPLFRTAAREFGERVVGVVLSGALSDGVYGLSVIKRHGGVAIVQDPRDAIIGSMPTHAIESVDVDHVVPASEIAPVIEGLTHESSVDGDAVEDADDETARFQDLEPQLPPDGPTVPQMEGRYGGPSPLTCPDCGGALWEIKEGRVVRYQCHVGHQYAPHTLDAEQRATIDSALWAAVRVLEEHVELTRRMARQAAANGLSIVSEGFEDDARDAHGQAQEIRAVLLGKGAGADDTHARSQAVERQPPLRKMAGAKRRR